MINSSHIKRTLTSFHFWIPKLEYSEMLGEVAYHFPFAIHKETWRADSELKEYVCIYLCSYFYPYLCAYMHIKPGDLYLLWILYALKDLSLLRFFSWALYTNIIWIHIWPGSKTTNFFLLDVTSAIPWITPEKRNGIKRINLTK